MTTVDVILMIVIMLVLLAVAGALLFLVVAVLDDHRKAKERERFKQSLRESVKHSQPSWNQVKTIASARSLSKREVTQVLKELLTIALEGDIALKPHINLVESYVEADAEEEPFEDMPQQIRIHLERLKEQLSNRPELLEALVAHLRDAKIETVRQRRRQNMINVLSLIAGLVGLLIGLVPIIRK